MRVRVGVGVGVGSVWSKEAQLVSRLVMDGGQNGINGPADIVRYGDRWEGMVAFAVAVAVAVALSRTRIPGH